MTISSEKFLAKLAGGWYRFRESLIVLGWMKSYEQLLFGTYPTKQDGLTEHEFHAEVNKRLALYSEELGVAQYMYTKKLTRLGHSKPYLPQPELILRRAIRASSHDDLDL